MSVFFTCASHSYCDVESFHRTIALCVNGSIIISKDLLTHVEKDERDRKKHYGEPSKQGISGADTKIAK